ncbi:MAG: DUF2958 domain-containing protein [Chloroflexota bacterium]
MGWIEKERKTSLEAFPIHGLFFLDGDIIAAFLGLKHGESPTFNPDWLKGHKLPKIEFPSGEAFDVWESSPEAEATVHLFGEMDLAYRATRNEAFSEAQEISELIGYGVRTRGEQQLDVWSREDDEHFTLTYDNDDRRIINVERLREAVEPPIHPAHILINDEIRAQLPPLYANEHMGLEALAPVKYFAPAANWTWYATEASAQMIDDTYKPLREIDLKDPQVQDVIFFGLVIGFEIELGYFTLAELQSIHGGLELPIERDLYYQPQSLRELQKLHHQERNDR